MINRIINAVIKDGILYEAKNVDTEISIPTIVDGEEKIINIKLRIENIVLRCINK